MATRHELGNAVSKYQANAPIPHVEQQFVQMPADRISAPPARPKPHGRGQHCTKPGAKEQRPTQR